MKINLEILKILKYFFLQKIMVWGALSFNNDNTDIYFDLNLPTLFSLILFSRIWDLFGPSPFGAKTKWGRDET